MKLQEEDFEAQMRAALRREPAPPDFTAKVLARTRPRVVTIPYWRRPAVWALAAGLAAAAIVPPAVSEHNRKKEARALEARRELVLALNITRAQLQLARQKVQHATRHTL